MQLLDEAKEENDPAEHEMQLEAPVSAEYVPAAHPSHALAPEEGQYLPWVHSVQLLDEKALHVPVNPLLVDESSDVKVTLRKPVVDV